MLPHIAPNLLLLIQNYIIIHPYSVLIIAPKYKKYHKTRTKANIKRKIYIPYILNTDSRCNRIMITR